MASQGSGACCKKESSSCCKKESAPKLCKLRLEDGTEVECECICKCDPACQNCKGQCNCTPQTVEKTADGKYRCKCTCDCVSQEGAKKESCCQKGEDKCCTVTKICKLKLSDGQEVDCICECKCKCESGACQNCNCDCDCQCTPETAQKGEDGKYHCKCECKC